MRKRVFTYLLVIAASSAYTQSFWTPSDTLNRPRLHTLGGVGGGVAVGSLAGLYTVWYSDYPQSSFHGINDFPNWHYMDKMGHALTTYSIGQNFYSFLRWTGLDERQSIWYGGLTGWTYLAAVEVMDGFSDGWGFSTGDLLFNTAGSGLFIGQQLYWGEQRIQMKFGYHRTNFPQYNTALLGNGWTEEWLKDYNGQTYWLSVNPASFMSEDTWWPQWLNIAGGYGATGMIGAEVNPMIGSDGQPLPAFARGSQYYLSLDIDLTRIPVKNDFLRGLFRVINVIKIPAPTLEYRTTDERFYFHPIYY